MTRQTATTLDVNRTLANRARQQARLAPAASLDRKAWGCCAVVLSTTGTLATARAALADIHEPEVQAAARKRLDELARDAPSHNQPGSTR